MSSSIEARHRLRVAAEHDRARLDRFLAEAVPALSRTRLKALIEEGWVSVGGRTIAEPAYRVKRGQAVGLRVPPATDDALPAGQHIALDIVYEDDAIIVIDKPAGLVVHPAPGNPDRTLVNALIAHCGASLSGIGGVRRPGIVHRLDKDTSGLLVAAKHDAAHLGLSGQFAERTLSRTYRAVVWGVPRPVEGEISGNIGRSQRNRKKMAVVPKGGKPARTFYRVLEALGPAWSLVECRLESGRTHQIRVHLTSRGNPVVGDPLYGGARAGSGALGPARRAALERCPRQALHACRLRLLHPVSGAALVFESPLPADIRGLVTAREAGEAGAPAPGPPDGRA